MVTENGYAGSREYEPAGIVHRGGFYAPCSCGGGAQIFWDGELDYHSQPVDYNADHLIRFWTTDKIWKYEIVE